MIKNFLSIFQILLNFRHEHSNMGTNIEVLMQKKNIEINDTLFFLTLELVGKFHFLSTVIHSTQHGAFTWRRNT